MGYGRLVRKRRPECASKLERRAAIASQALCQGARVEFLGRLAATRAPVKAAGQPLMQLATFGRSPALGEWHLAVAGHSYARCPAHCG